MIHAAQMPPQGARGAAIGHILSTHRPVAAVVCRIRPLTRPSACRAA